MITSISYEKDKKIYIVKNKIDETKLDTIVGKCTTINGSKCIVDDKNKLITKFGYGDMISSPSWYTVNGYEYLFFDDKVAMWKSIYTYCRNNAIGNENEILGMEQNIAFQSRKKEVSDKLACLASTKLLEMNKK